MAKTPFTVIGFPRSGTRYVAQLLSKNGIACVHEGYDPFNLNSVPKPTMNMVSGVVGDWNKDWRFLLPAVLIVRDPKEVVKSYHTILQEQRRIMEIWIDGHTHFEDLWKVFNQRVEATFQNIKRFKVETLENHWDEFVAHLGYPEVPLLQTPQSRVNSCTEMPSYGKKALRKNVLFHFLRLRYGY